MTEFGVGDAPELADHILRAYTDAPPGVVRDELRRFLWNSCTFGIAAPLAHAAQLVRAGDAGNFVYHQRSGLVFTGVQAHPLLMSYLATLDRTDFSARVEAWGPDTVYSWDATSKLADEFIEKGRGLYRSAVGGGSIMVARGFNWTAQEKRVFAAFPRRSPDCR